MNRYNEIDIEIQWQRLIAIMDEIDNATVKSSFSTIVGESRDFACILVDSKGRSLCQSSYSPPNFCVILPRTVKAIIEKIGINNYSTKTIEEIMLIFQKKNNKEFYIIAGSLFLAGAFSELFSNKVK